MERATQPKDSSHSAPAAQKPLFQSRPFTSDLDTAQNNRAAQPITPPADLQARDDSSAHPGFDITKFISDRPARPITPALNLQRQETAEVASEQTEPTSEPLSDLSPPLPPPPISPQSKYEQIGGIDISKFLPRSRPSEPQQQTPQIQSQTILQRQTETVIPESDADPENLPIQTKLAIQTKLTIGAPGDKYEQEADQMAAQVMAMPEPSSPPLIQQKIQQKESVEQLEGEEEPEEIQAKPLVDSITPLIQRQPEDQSEEIQTKSTVPTATTQTSTSLESQLASQKGGGSALPDQVRSHMEPRFGADFSQVRVHTDSSAIQMNKDLRAQAFTHGSDVYFGAGKSPGKNELTAHELTHVVQQTGRVQAKAVLSLDKKINKLQTKTDPSSASGLTPKQPLENSLPQPSAPVGNQAQPGAQNGSAAGSLAGGKPPSAKASPASTGGAKSPLASPAASGKGGAVGRAVVDEGAGAQKDKAAGGRKEKGLAGGGVGAGGEGGTAIGGSGKTSGGAIAGGKSAPGSPHQDPAFEAVVDKVKNVGQQQQQHASAPAKAQEAQGAAVAPANEVESKAQANQVGQMEQAETPPFNAAEFKAALMQKIAEAAPKNLEEADDFKKNNKLESVKGDLGGKVKDEKQATQKPLEEKTKQAPDTSGIEPKPVTPMSPPQPGQAPADVGAAQAIPKPKGQDEVEAPIAADSQKIDQKLAEANVTEEQLAKSNEPEFQATLKSKQTAQTHAAQVPQEYRQFEQGQLAQAKGEATATAQDKTQGMHTDRAQLLGQVGGQQVETKGKDEQQRTQVAGDINKIYQDTKTKVEQALSNLDTKVTTTFDQGATAAKQVFEDFVDQKMRKYKDDRYSGFWGPGKWLIDKVFGMPSEVNAFYEEGRNLYLQKMDGVINQVVAIVGEGLTQAKTEVANGKRQVQTYVAHLPENLKAIGQQAASDIEGKFGELEQSIDSKKDELIDTLAQKYQEKLAEVDASIEEKKDANRGLIAKAIDAVVGVIKTIIELGKLLLQVLARVASVIPQILKDPIGFFNNLVSGLKQGFQNFTNNIVQHLKKGLIGWLTGALAGAGIQFPEKFDLQGIFSLVAQLLGLGYEVIRAGLVKRFGEKKVSHMEKTVKVFQLLVAEGIAGIWQLVQEKVGDLKAMVMDNIQGFIIESIVKAGIMWVISLLNPASAFVRACKAIYDLITFFMENAARIADFMNTLLDSLVAIAAGNVAQVAKGIEASLAKAIPLVLELLAKLLGLGNVSQKVHEIIKKLQKPVKGAIDWVIDQAVKLAKKVGKFAKKVGGKIGFGKGKAKDNKEKKDKSSKPDERTMEQKKADVHKAIIEAEKTMEEKGATPDSVKAKLPTIQSTYKLTSIGLVKEKSNKYHIEAKINPGEDSKSEALQDGSRKPATIKKILFETNSSYKDSEGNELFGDELKEKFESFQRGLLDEKLASRKQTYKEIRGEDKKWAELQGVIYAPFIRDNQQAISKLQEKMEGCKYLISLERGGSFLAEQIARGQRIIINEKQRTPNISIEKPSPDEYKAKHQEELKNKIIEIMRKQKNANITIAIAETLVGGGSRDALIKTANEILDKGEYPNLKFKLLLLQQTIHTEDEGEGIVEQGITRVSGIMKAHQIQLVTASTRYILGEDVGYQLAKSGGNSKKPVIVFQGTQEELVAYEITPDGETTARDIIIDLNAGLYTGLLPPIV
jgi:Domain of unknown function (DUF4157)